jgi:hypothetical protein
MLLWSDGSPAHTEMEPFHSVDDGWEANLKISRSVREGTRWLPLKMKFPLSVRQQWDAQAKSQRHRALQALAIYVRLTEWYQEDLGVLELR